MAFPAGSLAPKLLPFHRVFGPVYESDSGFPSIGSPISDGGPGGGGGSVDQVDFGDVPVIRVN
jgi:hypothetical protein